MDPKSFERIEKLNYVFGVLMILFAALFTQQAFALGVTIGVVLTCLNFAFIRHLVDRMLVVQPGKRSATALLLVPKMAGLLGAAALALFFLPISAIGLGVGFSVFLLSIMVESIRFMTDAAVTR